MNKPVTADDKHFMAFFGLELLRASHPQVRRLRKHLPKSSHHGNKIWKASALLLDYLSEFPVATGARVLEVGAGWGLGAIYTAKHCAAQVTALDIDAAVFPILNAQAAHNQVVITPWHASLESLDEAALGEFDVLLASDICFWDQAAPAVYTLICRAFAVGMRIIISDPGRPPFLEVVDNLPLEIDFALENWSVPHPHNYMGLILDIAARVS